MGTKAEVLDSNFFVRPVVAVAKDMLGKYLVIRHNRKTEAYRIEEVEAYEGEHDLASHARFGRKGRSSVMYEKPGTWYVYLIYGMYWMLNIVCEQVDIPGAILIRGVSGLNGPGKITKTLHIDKRFNGLPALPKTNLWIEDRGERITPNQIKTTPRINVNYAGPEWAGKHYRFLIN